MVRTAQFTSEAFVNAAMELAAEGGSSAATMAAISRKVGAPTGSIYHRFDSRAEILALAWAQCHLSFCERLCPVLREGYILAAALDILAWSRENPLFAKFLFLNEIDTLLEGNALPEALTQKVQQQETLLGEAFQGCLSALTQEFGDLSENFMVRLKFFLFDGLISLLKPYLLGQIQIPLFIEEIIRDLYDFVLAQGARDLKKSRSN